jgi:hypothetical protein
MVVNAPCGSTGFFTEEVFWPHPLTLPFIPFNQGRGNLRDCSKLPEEMIEKYIPERKENPFRRIVDL